MRWLLAVGLCFSVWGYAGATPSMHPLHQPMACQSCPTNYGVQSAGFFNESNPDAVSLSWDQVTRGPRPRIFGIPTFEFFLYSGFIAAVVSGVLGARVTLVAGRGPYAITAHPLLGLVANVSVMASLVWGFVQLPWYWPLTAFGVATVVSGLLVNRHTLLALLGRRWAIDILTIVGASVLWWRFYDL